MKLSIIVPVYNNKEWLPKCFDSILNQTYSNYEVIIVDDISTDNGIVVLEEYQKKFKDKGIECKIFINKTKRLNGGTRNVGIAEATGDYVLCIDCDDTFIDNKVFEDIANKLNGEDILFLDYVVHTKDYDMTCEQHYNNKYEALRGFTCALWTRCVKRTFLLDNLQKEGTLFEDLGQNYRLIVHCNSFAYLGRPTHIWNRLNANSISNMTQYKFYIFNFCGELYELIQELPEGEDKEYLKGKLREYVKAGNDMVNEL